MSAEGGSKNLQNLQGHTEYTRHLSVLPKNEMAVITFTTLGVKTYTRLNDVSVSASYY